MTTSETLLNASVKSWLQPVVILIYIFFLNCITIVTLLSMLLTPCKVLVNSHIFLCSQNVHKSDMLMTIKRYLILKVVFKKVFNVET